MRHMLQRSCGGTVRGQDPSAALAQEDFEKLEPSIFSTGCFTLDKRGCRPFVFVSLRPVFHSRLALHSSVSCIGPEPISNDLDVN